MTEDIITCPECGAEFATKEAHDIHHTEKHTQHSLSKPDESPIDEEDKDKPH